jgi:predicted Zn-dependent protease
MGDQAVGLGTLRQAYARLFDLYGRVVLSARGQAETDWAIDGALGAAAQWRRDDPDNADIDRRCANLLFEAHRPKEAMRYLASITERHPTEGQAYADVAEVLERRGEDADAVWARAIEVEPTNPTWLVRRAQNLLAQNAPRDRVRALLDQVEKGTWQPRFSNVKDQAKRLEASL